MSRVEDRLEELGISLPAAMVPPGNFKLVNVDEGVAYVSGHAPMDGSRVLVEGVVGSDLSVEQGYEAARLTAARLTALTILASLKQELGDLDRLRKWLRAVGYLQSARASMTTPEWSTASAI